MNALEQPLKTAAKVEASPTVSVVIPTKNRADFLRGTIESILTQDYPNIECIVADGGSTDGTIELLKSYGDRIRWFSEPDRGAFDAINKGWAQSCGSILAWLNSDDEWEPGAVQVAVNFLDEHPDVSVVYGSCGAIDDKGELIALYPPRPWDLREALENCDHIIHQAATFMRRAILEQVDYLYPAWCHDHDLWLRVALAGGKFGSVPEVLANARVWPENLGNNPAIIIPGKVGLTERFFATPGLPASIASMRRRAKSNAYLRCISYISPQERKNWPICFRLLVKAALADPSNSPHLFRQVTYFAGNRFPLLFRLLATAKGLLASALRSPGTLVVLAIAVGYAIATGPHSAVSGAAIFFFVSLPLLLALLVKEAARR